jgi:C4-dicarboxylate transporter, DctM subunit
MNPVVIALIAIAIVLALAMFRVPIALALGIVGVVGTALFKGWPALIYVAGTAPFEVLNNYALSVLPLFILMGELAVRSALARGLVEAANVFLGHRRGGLASASCVASAGFGAICGSDIATLSAMTKITVPEMMRVGYSKRLAAGSLAAAGTLGILIPPSVPMIIFGYMTETSIGRLFVGGFIPGVILTILYVAAVGSWVRIYPQDAPTLPRIPLRKRMAHVWDIWPVAAIFAILTGGIYTGYFSPTEGGAVGAAGMLILGVAKRKLDITGIVASLRGTVILSAVIFFILIGIELFHFFMDSIGLQASLASTLKDTTLRPIVVVGMILLVLMALGCVMDSMAIMFITVPFLNPVIIALGYDPVWFGVTMIMVVSLGLITPPFGLNVFLLSAMIPEISIREAFRGVLPFVIADIVLIALCLAFPDVILWLPNLLFK